MELKALCVPQYVASVSVLAHRCNAFKGEHFVIPCIVVQLQNFCLGAYCILFYY